ncbi:MAG: efflux RND transporter periplasmic adaptor subunit [Pseudomonadota bacterium]
MKTIPVVIAVLVAVILYTLVFERDRLSAMFETGEESPTEVAEADPSPPEEEEEIVSVVAMMSKARPVDSAVILRGQTEAAREVEVKSQASGLVTSDPLRKGAFVSTGDLLCEIEPGTLPAQMAEAEARLAEAKIENVAAERLAEGGFGSETRKVAARATLQAAEAAVELANTEIDRLKITAPFDGVLESDSAELGSLLQPGAACATIIQLDPIKLVGFLPETDVGRVSLGAGASARFINGETVAGKVTFLARSADPDTRTFRVEIQVPNDDLVIRDGQSAEISISSAGITAHLVPQSALTLDNSGQMGLRTVESGDIVGFSAVDIVRDTSEGVWVTGLPEEGRVIVVGQEFVTDGVPVKVTLGGPDL